MFPPFPTYLVNSQRPNNKIIYNTNNDLVFYLKDYYKTVEQNHTYD